MTTGTAGERNIPTDFPAHALDRFWWPISEGVTLGALALVREGGKMYARVYGMARQSTQEFEPVVYAELEVTDEPQPFPGDKCNCGARVGEKHKKDCDVAVCLATGIQRLMCDGRASHPGEGCGHDVWTGKWPGVQECEDYGWYAIWVDPEPGQQFGRFEACPKDHPGGRPDLNRLMRECRWDRAGQRWVIPGTAPGAVTV